MTILVDTGVVYADHDTDASRHEAASRALEAVYDGEWGQPYVSDYVFDEAITLTRKRSGAFEPARRLGARLRGVDPYPKVYELLRISAPVFDDAIDVFERFSDHSLSFTDATTVALCDRRGIDHVLSFDDDFDGVYSRIDPDAIK